MRRLLRKIFAGTAGLDEQIVKLRQLRDSYVSMNNSMNSRYSEKKTFSDAHLGHTGS